MTTRLGVAIAAALTLLPPRAVFAQQPGAPPPTEPAAEAPTRPPEAPQGPPGPPTPTDPNAPSPDAPAQAEAEPSRPAPSPPAADDAAPVESPAPVPEDSDPRPPSGPPEQPPTDAPTRAADVAPATARQEAPRGPVDDRPVIYTLEGISIRGNTRTRDRVVLRYIPFKAGDILDVSDPAVELVRYRLLGTGFFRNVELSLEKGTRPGRVFLVVTVEERNTIIVNDIWMGLAADANNVGQKRPLIAYGGVDVAETNLAGTGITLGGAMGIAPDQLAMRVRFLDPSFLGGPIMTSGSLLFNDARDYFGNPPVFYSDLATSSTGVPSVAIAQYKRFGGLFGIGHDLAVPTQLWINYRLEGISADLPAAASQLRGTTTEPIEFDVLPGRSVLSTLSTTLQHDTRDHPILPTIGWFAAVTGEVSLAPLGSDYAYTRVDARVSRWWRLPWRHILRLEVFGGAISGDAPFFEKYYAADLSDFRASRVLGLNVERRRAPNVFDTSVVEIRRGDYAAKITGEYRLPLYRGSRSVYGIDLFASAGLFGLASARDLRDPPSGYSGFRRVPIDFTANLGFRMDTSAGGFTFAFANAFGFLPPLNRDR
jgi:outer membrane protein assembly factor BamA